MGGTRRFHGRRGGRVISYLVRRILFMVLVLFLVSVTSFIIIRLPPGDWLSSYVMQLRVQGADINDSQIQSLKAMYGLDKPGVVQYFKWITGIFSGDFGRSFQYNKPVLDLLKERLPLTLILSLMTIILTYLLAIPIGIFSATHQYSAFDYTFTFLGFIGLSIPAFLLALLLSFLAYRFFGLSIGGLFSAKYLGEPMSWAKFVDMLGHLPIPLLVISFAGTAGIIRVMRGCLLDELKKQYVETGRAKGLSETRLLLKYPVRMAMNPIISTIGWLLPAVFSGETVVAIVLGLPTTGPLLYEALRSQDTYLAGSIILMLSALTVVGTFLSDVLLAVSDPRIRMER